MEEKIKKNVKKKMILFLAKPAIIAIIVGILILILLSAFHKVIVDDDTKEDRDDPKNAPGVVANYMDDINFDAAGNITSGKTIQELWDEMIANGNRIKDYLNSPQELAKLINAQRATEFLDTRADPDKPIDWTKFNNDVTSKKTQGLTKLKRRLADGKTITMTYVKPETFQKYIDKYNSTGSEKAKENAMKHFTIEETTYGSSGSDSPSGSADISTATLSDFSQETKDIINKNNSLFDRGSYKKFMKEQGGIDKYIKSLGGVFTKYGGKNVKAKVKTAGDIKEVAEYVWGLAFIWGFDYGNGSTHHPWTGGGERFETSNSPAYNKSNVIEEICDSGPRRTNCDYGLNAFWCKAGHSSFRTWNQAGKKITKKSDLKVGDIIYMKKGYTHVAMVGEIDKSKNKIILYDFAKFRKGVFKVEFDAKDGGRVTKGYNGYKSWYARRPFNIDPSTEITIGANSNSTPSDSQSSTDTTSTDTTSVGSNTNDGLSIVTKPSITKEEFVKKVKNYTVPCKRGSTSTFRNNAEVIWDVCTKNNLNPVLCVSQARQESSWYHVDNGEYNYWGIGSSKHTKTGSYKNMEEGVQAWCDKINGNMKKESISEDYSKKLKPYDNHFTGGINNIYDVLSSWSQVEDALNHLKEQAGNVVDYISKISKCSKNIFGKGALLETDGNADGSTYTDDDEDEENSRKGFKAVIATWSERTEKTTSNVEDDSSETTYSITTQQIPYQELVSKYTMPFNYLWDFLVLGNDKQFVFDMADLVYGSQFEITVHDNYTETTTIVTNTFSENTRVKTTASVYATVSGSKERERVQKNSLGQEKKISTSETVKREFKYNNRVKEKTTSKKCKTVETTIDKSNTVECALTLADSWYIRYENKYQHNKSKKTDNTSTKNLKDIPEAEGRQTGDPGGFEKAIISEAKAKAEASCSDMKNKKTTASIIGRPVTKYYHSTTNRVKTTRTIEKASSYIATPVKSNEDRYKNPKRPNFVSLFRSNYSVRSSILSAKEWLWDILEKNDKTKNMVDLTKYLFYLATGTDYGVTEFDFDAYQLEEFNDTAFGGIVGGNLEEKVWFALRGIGISEYATAGVMGNIHAESGFKANSLEGKYTYEQIMSNPKLGLGMCGWTAPVVKKPLIEFAKSKNDKWTNEDIQVEYLMGQLKDGAGAVGYAKRKDALNNNPKHNATISGWEKASSPEEAAYQFCWIFERPKASVAHMDRRQKMARKYYNQFHGKTAPSGNNMAGSPSGNKIIDEANKYVGNKYVFGGDSLTHGIDCSHFVYRILRDKCKLIPQSAVYHPTSAMQDGKLKDWGCTYIGTNPNDAKKGDIIIYGRGARGIHHTAFYAGNGRIIEAQGKRAGITNNRSLTHESIAGIYRVGK